jgi:hypothetical protein
MAVSLCRQSTPQNTHRNGITAASSREADSHNICHPVSKILRPGIA